MPKRVNKLLRGRSVPELVGYMLKRGSGLASATLRLLPDFMIIGAQRSGTTSLYNYLSQHPDVYPSFPKEVHFFSNYYHQGTNWYRSHFPMQRQKVKIEGDGGRRFITGEATPYYLFHPHAARRAAQVVPDARLIVLLRNPVARAYSHYYHEVRMGAETLSFEEAIRGEAERLKGEREKIISDEYYRSYNFQHFSYLQRGHYWEQIQEWLRYFQRDAILLLNSDQMDENPANIFRQVTDFLSIDPTDKIQFKKYHVASNPKMNPEIYEQLSNYFQPYNQMLSEFTGIHFDSDH
jgi:hypothetical protein